MSVDFAAALSHLRHDLRTPMNALIGYGEMILEDDVPGEDFRARLQEIPLISKQVLEVITQTLGNPPEDAVLPQLVDAARKKLAPLGERLFAGCRAVEDMAKGRDFGSALPDIEKMLTASRNFLGMLEHADATAPPAVGPAAAVERAPAPSFEGPSVAAEAIEFTDFQGHVLVVDDNAANREILARSLIKEKRHFALAGNGAQALEMLQSRAFDLVLLDIMMPEMDGFEVLSRIKADPAIRHTPVIMISALDQIDSVVRCIEKGAEDYLPKPFNPLLLRARVGTCLEKKRLRDLELEYLRQVALLTDSAAAVETGSFDVDLLNEVGQRDDALGNLARVFQKMAREVRAREVRLQMQVQKLTVEIDEVRKAKQVAEITETDYFQDLQKRAKSLKERRGK